MPDLVYIANKSNYLVTELTVLSESETHYNTYNAKTDKYQSWIKSKCYTIKQNALNEVEHWHNLKISELENSITAAQKKLETFKEKYNV